MHLIMKFHNKIKCAILFAYSFLPAILATVTVTSIS